MNPNATSKANILKTSRELIQQNGWAGVNIRSVAAACGVSVGCIYNYFASKTELLSATVESIWSDIFHHPENEVVFQDTLSCVRWMYQQLEDGCQRYPGFFHPPCAGLCPAGHRRWKAADASGLAAHSGCPVCGAAE